MVKHPHFLSSVCFACFASILSLLSLFPLKAQDLGAPTNACPNADITFTNPSPGASKTKWDFCPGELLETPTSGSMVLSDISGTNRPEHFTTVFDGTNWYAFITNRNLNTITRLDFGTNIKSTPTIASDIAGATVNALLDQPQGIKIVKQGNNWLGIVANFAADNLLILNFGTSLTNTPTAQVVTTPVGIFDRPARLEVIYANGNWYALAANNRKYIGVVNFGPTISSTPVATSVSSNVGSNDVNSIAVIKDGSNWYGIATGYSGKVYHLSYGNDLLNSPTIVDMSGNIGTLSPLFDGHIKKEKNNFVYFTVTPAGSIYRLKFGTSMTNKSPTLTTFDRFDVIGNGGNGINPSSLSISLAKQESEWFIFAVNRTNGGVNQIARLNLPVFNCNVKTLYAENTNTTLDNSFFSAGTFDITVENLDANNAVTSSYVDQITINASVIPNFSIANKCLGETTTITNTSIGNESDVLTWEWSFGDGTTSNNKNPTHQYTTPGTYTISLTPKTTSGLCDNAFQQTVKIRSVPQANFTISDQLAADSAIQFTNTSTNFTKNIATTFQWIINEGSGFRYFNENPTHTFGQPGVYNVILSVTDTTGGCSSVMSKSLTIGAVPAVGFQLSQKACTQNPITLMDTSSVSDIVGSKIVSYQWNFGGGVANQSSTSRPDTLQNPVVTFGFATTYEITLTVTTNLGVSSTVKKLVTFEEGMSSQMSASVTSGDTPLSVSFSNQNTNAVSYSWDFGDGNTSTEANPTHVYTNPGIYTVIYKAIGTNGCSIPKYQQIIASAPNNVLEAEMSDVSINGDQLLASITNNGNTPITNLTIQGILNKRDTVTWQWAGVINSLASETITFNLGNGQGDTTWHVCANILTVNNTQDAKTTNNQICKNTLDVQTTSVIVQDNQYLITIRNNEIVPIKSLKIKLDLGNNQFLDTEWSGLLNSGQQINILGNIPAPYLCATITQINGSVDAILLNNLGCQDFSSEFRVLSLNPNPAVDFINIDYFLPQSPTQDVVQLQVISGAGRVKGKVQLLNLSPGRNTYRYNTSSLTSGLYYLMFIRGNKTITRKVLIK